MDYSKLNKEKLVEILNNQAKIFDSIDTREQELYDHLIEHEADSFTGWEILELMNKTASRHPHILGKEK